MPYQTWIFDAAKETGYPVVEVEGWRTRGSETFNPSGLVWHHTAWPMTNSDMPSLQLLISGRSDVPGPLANFGLGRSGTIYVLAAGRANHAGNGGWRGLSGNSSVFGIEAEHPGTSGTPWGAAQLDAYAKLSAVLAKRGGFDVEMVCGHKEWAPTRKVDPIDLDMDDMRRRIALAMEGEAVKVYTPIERKHADVQGDGSRKSDIGAVSRLMNNAYGLSLPEDGTWGTAMEDAVAKLFPKAHKPREWMSGKDYADLLIAVAERNVTDVQLREAYNTHRHPGLLSPAPRAEDKVN